MKTPITCHLDDLFAHTGVGELTHGAIMGAAIEDGWTPSAADVYATEMMEREERLWRLEEAAYEDAMEREIELMEMATFRNLRGY